MKKYSLSSPADRVTGAAVSAALVLLMAVLVFVLRKDLLTLIIVAACAILVTAVLVFYVANLYKAACVPDAREKKLTVLGFPDYSIDLADAVSMQTVSYQNGPLATRTLIISDAHDEVLTSIPTFFFSRQGCKAEPLAKELAAQLELVFVPSLEPWEYDDALRKEHEKEVAKAEKAARKAKFQKIKNKFLQAVKAGRPTPTASEEETAVEYFDEENDGVNYDAMDDEK